MHYAILLIAIAHLRSSCMAQLYETLIKDRNLSPGCHTLNSTKLNEEPITVLCTGLKNSTILGSALEPYRGKVLGKLVVVKNYFYGKTLGPEAFEKMVEVRALLLLRNHVTKMADDLLKALGAGLKSFVFEENYSLVSSLSLTQFPPTFFHPLTRATLISIVSPHVNHIHDDTFARCQALESLFIKAYRLNDLGESAFSGLSNLKMLHLKADSHVGLRHELLAKVPALKILYLSLSNHVVLPRDLFSGLGRLNHLEFVGSGIEKISNETLLPIARNLEFLSLVANELENLEYSFPHMPNLKALHLSFNKLSEITLISFKNLPQLLELQLDFNKISSVDYFSFVQNPLLKQLNLRYNDVEELSAPVLAGITNLTKLDFMGNSLGHLDDKSFVHNPKLEYLSFADNSIHAIASRSFDGLDKSLTFLDLMNNDMGDDSLKSLQNLTNLRYLNISSNKLTTLEAATFGRFNQLEKLKFHGNPWVCDYRMGEFIDWFNNWTLAASEEEVGEGRAKDLAKAKCSSPVHLKDISFYIANQSLFIPDGRSTPSETLLSILGSSNLATSPLVEKQRPVITHPVDSKRMNTGALVTWIAMTVVFAACILLFAIYYIKRYRRAGQYSETACLRSSNVDGINHKLSDLLNASKVGALIKGGKRGYNQHSAFSSFT